MSMVRIVNGLRSGAFHVRRFGPGGWSTVQRASTPVEASAIAERIRRAGHKASIAVVNPGGMGVFAVGGIALLVVLVVLLLLRKSASAQSVTQLTPVGSVGQTVRKSVEFHLRATATAASTGTVLPAGTAVMLVSEASPRIYRASDQGVLWRVRTAAGAEGYTFILPGELR